MSKEAYVKKEVENGIALVEFFHPAHNSLPGDILTKLANTIKEVGEDPEVKVVIMQSGGDRTFCAGASFNELIAINDEATGKGFFSVFAKVINDMRKCVKFIVCRVHVYEIGSAH